MSRVVRSRAAERDFIEIWNYIAADDSQAADKLLFKLEDQANFLADFPKSGSPRPELGRDARSFVIGNYLIIYRPIADGIRLLRILNASRDVSRAMRRRKP